jgi:putative tryptophan/tyrosine transport system substrate-binding protein
MQRREFIALLGTAAAWPLTAQAQQPKKPPTIGFLGTTTAAAWSNWVAAFAQRLRELGWIDGSTLAIKYRWADGRNERFSEIAAEFVRLKVDVIVTSGGAGLAAKQATTTIPIVFAVANDPIADGLVVSLARPGGNVTGLSLLAPDLAGKRFELVRESLVGLRRLAILADSGYAPSGLEMGDVFALARAAGVEASKTEIRQAEDIVPAIEQLKGTADALYVCTGPLVSTNRVRINTSALAAQLPTIHGVKEYVEAGGLMSYGPSYTDLFSRAGEYVDKILRGAKPGDLPIEQPTRFELIINLTTAKALGLTISPTLLARADEVIE